VRIKLLLDGTLLRITKWLRAIGVDTVCQSSTTVPAPVPGHTAALSTEAAVEAFFSLARREGRVVVTQNKALLRRRGAPVSAYAVEASQMAAAGMAGLSGKDAAGWVPLMLFEDICAHFGFRWEESLFYTRCTTCNAPVERLQREVYEHLPFLPAEYRLGVDDEGDTLILTRCTASQTCGRVRWWSCQKQLRIRQKMFRARLGIDDISDLEDAEWEALGAPSDPACAASSSSAAASSSSSSTAAASSAASSSSNVHGGGSLDGGGAIDRDFEMALALSLEMNAGVKGGRAKGKGMGNGNGNGVGGGMGRKARRALDAGAIVSAAAAGASDDAAAAEAAAAADVAAIRAARKANRAEQKQRQAAAAASRKQMHQSQVINALANDALPSRVHEGESPVRNIVDVHMPASASAAVVPRELHSQQKALTMLSNGAGTDVQSLWWGAEKKAHMMQVERRIAVETRRVMRARKAQKERMAALALEQSEREQEEAAMAASLADVDAAVAAAMEAEDGASATACAAKTPSPLSFAAQLHAYWQFVADRYAPIGTRARLSTPAYSAGAGVLLACPPVAHAHSLCLGSAYASASPLDEEPPFTNCTDRFKAAIDYLLFSRRALRVQDVHPLVGPDELARLKLVGFPSAHWPSDHLLLRATYCFC
jgi:uncharacterized protein with PIN domain